VAEQELPDEIARTIRERKRWTWSQQGAGKEYQFEAFKADPVIRLKNLTEMTFVLESLRGNCMLDAGSGTGRFTFPLVAKGHNVAGVDISGEMLREGKEQAGRLGLGYPCVRGDIERLPFGNAAFDTVVSITVLRHFPQWRQMLAEYARVLRVGGRILFDMASGEQRAFMARMFPEASSVHAPISPMTYETAATLAEVERASADLGLTVVAAMPHDFFNGNALLEHVLGSRFARFDAENRRHLENEGALRLCQAIQRRVFPVLSPAVSSSWCIALEKRGGNQASYSPPYRDRSLPNEGGAQAETIGATVQALLGWKRRSCMQELRQALQEPDAQAIWRFWREEALPYFPPEALVFEDR